MGFPKDGTMQGHEYIPLKELETIFNATGSPTTLAMITTGALYVVFVNNDTGTAIPQYYFNCHCRLRFTD